MASPPKKIARYSPLDPVELLKLSPPLSVQVHKLYYNDTRSLRIDVPAAAGGEGPGEGYTHELVKEIHRLLERISGGGWYNVQAMDGSANSLKFSVWLKEDLIPDKVSPESIRGLQEAGAPPPAPQAPVAQSAQEWINQQPAGIPRHMVGAAMAQGANGTAAPQPPSASVLDLQRREEDARQRAAEARTAEERVRAAEEQTRILREQILARDYQARMEKAEAEHRRELDELRRAATAPADGVKEMIAAMHQRMEKAEEQHRRELEEMRRERAEGGTTQLIMAMMNQQQESTRAMMAMFAQKPSGPAPEMIMLIEAQKNQAEVYKEQLRSLNESIRERERTALSAKDVIEITREAQRSSGGAEMVKTTTEMMSAYMNATKALMELQGGGGTHPVAEVIGNVAEKAASTFKEFVTAQRDVQVGEQRARVAEAQARATAPGPRPVPQAVPTAAPAPGAQPMTDEQRVAAAAAELDVQRFGPAVEAIARLRLGVAGGKLSPEQCIDWLRTALPEIERLKWNVPAVRLLEEQRLDEFIRWVLPVVEPPFRQKLSEALTKFYEEEFEEDDEPATAGKAS